MLVVSLLLLTVWMFALANGLQLHGLVHFFGATALLIVLGRKTPRVRHR